MSRFREWSARFLLAFVSAAFGALALECVARVLVWNWSREPNVVRHPFAQYDPDLGWSKPANAHGILRRPEYRVVLEINSHGLRSPEIPLRKPADTKRVLLLGDSFTEGYTVEDSVSVRGRLEKRLNETREAPVQVINGGTAGWSTDQEVLFYEKTGRLFGSDLVILLFYYNDLYRDGDLAIQPWFEQDDSGALVLRNSPVPPHREFFSDKPFAIKPYRGSMALALLQPRLDSHPTIASFLWRFGLAERPAAHIEVPDEFQPFGQQRPREVRSHWSRMAALLARLKSRVGRDGARLVLFYVPARFEVDDRAWSLTRDLYGLNAHWDRNRVADELGRVAAEGDLPFIDPRAAFKRRENEGSQTYFPQDGHWTEAGNDVASAEILAAIAKRALLSSARP